MMGQVNQSALVLGFHSLESRAGCLPSSQEEGQERRWWERFCATKSEGTWKGLSWPLRGREGGVDMK